MTESGNNRKDHAYYQDDEGDEEVTTEWQSPYEQP